MKRHKEPEAEDDMVRVFLAPPGGRGMGWSGALLRSEIDFLMEAFREAAVVMELFKQDLAEAEAVMAERPPDMAAVLEISRRLETWVLLFLQEAEGPARERLEVKLGEWQRLRDANVAKARRVLEREEVAPPLAAIGAAR
jgi:hypothetical protein